MWHVNDQNMESDRRDVVGNSFAISDVGKKKRKKERWRTILESWCLSVTTLIFWMEESSSR